MIKMNLQMPAVLANPKIKISRIMKNIYLIPGFFSPHTSLDIVSVGVCVCVYVGQMIGRDCLITM